MMPSVKDSGFTVVAALVMISHLAAPPTRAQEPAINAASRTIQTSNFSVAWNTGADTEAVTTLEWMDGPNLTGANGLDVCSGGGPAYPAYLGNSMAPPDPQSGGLMLVGGGTTTPAGTVPWSAQVVGPALEVSINSTSSGCSYSAGINVQTTYRFEEAKNPLVNWFRVERVFDFTGTTFAHDFRPYVPRLLMGSGYTDVIYPISADAVAVIDASNCGGGCTGPKSEPGAAPLSPAWDEEKEWFAINNPATGQGVVVSRVPSADPQGNAIPAQLWVDTDAGPPSTNASSFLLVAPAGAFSGGLVAEVETFCFYNSNTWKPSPTPPAPCRNAPVSVLPALLTFPAQAVSASSAPQTAKLLNLGISPLRILRIVSGGDFAQTNDCPETLAPKAACKLTVTFTPTAPGIRSGAISILDARESSPQTLSLAGLGVAAQ